MKKIQVVGLCVAFSFAACGKNESENNADTNWFTGGFVFRSHEDLTRFGVELANSKIGWSLFPAIKEGDSSAFSINELVRGSYYTDFPDTRMQDYYASTGRDVFNKTYKASHFIRSFVNDVPVSREQACLDSKKQILQITNLALASWHVKDASSFFYWAGHASHTIQDSFAPGHVQRSGADLRKIDDVCTSLRKVDGICFHTRNLDDSIWNPRSGGTYDPSMRPWWAMKKEAQAASLATAGYFYMLNTAITTKTYDAKALLNEYFNSTAVFNGGYFVCEK